MRRASGFTLIEVLVSVMILSIGLLGSAALLLAAVRHNDSAFLRSQAALSAYALMDRLRANRATAVAGGYDLALSSLADLDPPGAGIAEIDRYDWFQGLDATLPSAQGAIDCTAAGVCTVTVQWDDARAEGSTALKQQVLAAQL